MLINIVVRNVYHYLSPLSNVTMFGSPDELMFDLGKFPCIIFKTKKPRWSLIKSTAHTSIRLLWQIRYKNRYLDEEINLRMIKKC